MKKRILAIAGILTIVAILAVPFASLAATGTTEISGSINAVLQIQAPSAISLGTGGVMAAGDNTGTSSDGNVNCNNAAGYTLTVADAMAAIGGHAKDSSITGYMWTGNADGKTLKLAGPLQVAVPSLLPLTAITSQQTAKTTSVPSYNDAFTLNIKQPVTNTDPAGSYQITLIFTVTAN